MARLIGLLAAALLVVGVGGLVPGPATSARAPAGTPSGTPAGTPTDTVVETIAESAEAGRRAVHGT